MKKKLASASGAAPGAPLEKTPKKRRMNRYLPMFCAFIAPAFLLYTLFFFVPLMMGYGYSLTDYDGYTRMNFVGLQNFIRILGDADFYGAVGRTIRYTLINLPFKVALPLLIAILMTSKAVKFKTIPRACIYVPVLISALVVGVTINWMFGQEYGLVNFLIKLSGGKPLEWALNPALATTVISVATNWARCGFFMVIFIGALNNIPGEIKEAAAIDGANGWQTFWRVTLPMINPTTFLVLLLTTNELLKEYAIIQGITLGGPGVATTFIVQYIYQKGFSAQQNGYASAASVLVLILFLGVAAVQAKVTKGGEID